MNEMTLKNLHAQFQTYDDPAETSESAPRLAALRAELVRRGLDGFVVPHADRHQNEYLPPSEERLAWLTGFTGSAGAAIVLAERAVLFVDGRYTLQARDQSDPKLFTIEHLVDTPPSVWIEANLTAGQKLGFDPWLHTAEGAERLAHASATAGAIPGAPPRCGCPARPAIRRRARRTKARPHSCRDQEAQGRCIGGLRSARGRLDLQYPRRRRSPHAASTRLCDHSGGRRAALRRRGQAHRYGAQRACRPRRDQAGRNICSGPRRARRRAPHGATRP